MFSWWFESLGNSYDRSRKQVFINMLRKNFFCFSWNCILSVIRIAPSRRFSWIHSTSHYFIEGKTALNNSHFPHDLALWLNLSGSNDIVSMSRTYFHGLNDVRGIEIRLYLWLMRLSLNTLSHSLCLRPRKMYQNVVSEPFRHLFHTEIEDSNKCFKHLLGRASALWPGGCGFDPQPSHTKGFKNGTSCYFAWRSALTK